MSFLIELETERIAFNNSAGGFFAQLDAPKELKSAMEYSFGAGGKRLRPCLFRLIHKRYSPLNSVGEAFAFALEAIHTYSLVHDDLPALDNDAMRRGKPSCHIAHGEDIAILAGDALLNLAYEIVLKNRDNEGRAVQALALLAEAIGGSGMIGGQTLDVLSERQPQTCDKREVLSYIHLNKTAKLLTASIVCGAIIGGAEQCDINLMHDYGKAAGMLFQIVDDILDYEGDSKTLGKATGKDTDKLTYVTVYGIDEAKKQAKVYCDRAKKSAQRLGFDCLTEFAEYLNNRSC